MESKGELQGSISLKLNLTVESEGQRDDSSGAASPDTEALLTLASLMSHNSHGFDQVFEGKL